MIGLSVEADDAETERYGKTVSDLQSAVTMGDGTITGTLHYVTGYTGFSSDTEEQSGNYLAVKIDAIDGAVITASIGEASVDLSEDKYLVARVNGRTEETLKIEAAFGGRSQTLEYALSDLTLEEDSD